MKLSLGSSLLELLIVMALSSMILLGVMAVYEAGQMTYNTQEALARIQETGHLVTALLTAQLRTAGYSGCGQLSASFPLTHYGVPVIMTPTDTFRADEQAVDPADQPTNRVPAEEGIKVLKMATTNADVIGIEPEQRRFQVSHADLFKAGDTVMMSHCRQGAVFKIKQAPSHGWLEAPVPLKDFRVGAMIGPIEQLFFYIGNTRRKTPRGNPIYALYVQDLAGKREEIAEGVSHWEIQYGVCQGSAQRGITRRAAKQITDWSKVISVHMVLTLDSVMEMGGSAKDTRLYKQWPLDIALRERRC